MDYDALKQQLKEDGFVVVRGLLSPEEARFYRSKLEEVSASSRRASQSATPGSLSKRGLSASYNLPDGVTKTPDFWPVIFHERLLTIVRNLIDPEIRYLQHSDLHVGFSAISWHRDNVSREFGVGPDWDESEEPYQIVRVGIYLQSFAESKFKLGFIKGSHRPLPEISLGRRFTEAKLKWLGAMSYMFVNLQMWASNAEWIPTEPGDCLIFDPRALHSGSYIVGPKYSMFVAYGKENEHFYNHQNYYRNIRTELNYGDMAPDLIRQLQQANLYPENLPSYDQIEGAWTPAPVLKNILSKKFK